MPFSIDVGRTDLRKRALETQRLRLELHPMLEVLERLQREVEEVARAAGRIENREPAQAVEKRPVPPFGFLPPSAGSHLAVAGRWRLSSHAVHAAARRCVIASAVAAVSVTAAATAVGDRDVREPHGSSSAQVSADATDAGGDGRGIADDHRGGLPAAGELNGVRRGPAGGELDGQPDAQPPTRRRTSGRSPAAFVVEWRRVTTTSSPSLRSTSPQRRVATSLRRSAPWRSNATIAASTRPRRATAAAAAERRKPLEGLAGERALDWEHGGRRLVRAGPGARERLRTVRGARRRRRGDGMNEEVALVERATAPRLAAAKRGELALPRLIVGAGPAAPGKSLSEVGPANPCSARSRLRNAQGTAARLLAACYSLPAI